MPMPDPKYPKYLPCAIRDTPARVYRADDTGRLRYVDEQRPSLVGVYAAPTKDVAEDLVDQMRVRGYRASANTKAVRVGGAIATLHFVVVRERRYTTGVTLEVTAQRTEPTTTTTTTTTKGIAPW